MFGHILTVDKRDEDFPISSILPSKDSPLVFKKWKIGDILNQGETSKCVAFASDLLLRSAPKIQKSPGPDFIYSECKKIDGIEGEGTSLRSAMKVLKERNLIRNYFWAKDVEDIVKYLCSTGPVLFGVKWFDGMSRPDDFGFASVRGSEVGHHAFLCYGVDVINGHFHMANSYGLFWGKGGTFKMRFEEISWLLRNQGLCVVPQEIDIDF